MPSAEVRLSEAATLDLIEIYTYLAGEIGHGRADAYTDRIESFCLSLGRFPNRGRSRPELAPGLRSLTFESRAVIVYRVEPTGVLVARVIHGARDIDSLVF